MKKLAVAMMGLVLYGQATGADWVEVGEVQDTKEVYYLDLDTIKPIKPNVMGYELSERFYSIFVKEQYPKNHEMRKKYGYHHTIINYYVACNNQSSLKKGVIAYGANGKIMGKWQTPKSIFNASDFEPDYPDTIAGEITSFVCN